MLVIGPATVLSEGGSALAPVDTTRMLVFGAIMLILTVAVLLWAVIVPERPPRPDGDPAGDLLERERRQARAVALQLEDETGRTDPSRPRET